MKMFKLFRLFRAIFSPGGTVDTESIERMGLLAVKIAQMYAVRADLLPAEKCLQLSRLLERAAPLKEEEFEKRWAALAPVPLTRDLAELKQPPLASASLGQVHRATLRDGREVVVKIAKREAREEFTQDVRQLRLLLQVALRLYPKLERLADPIGTLAAVERQTLTEMNFLAEQAGAERLATLAAERRAQLPHLHRLHFPKYLPEYSHEQLLVSEFVPGRTLAGWLEQGRLPYEALLDLFRIQGYFLFVRGQFHGDLHPGNVIWRDGQFWFLDNANVESVPPAFGRGLFQMMTLLGEGEEERAAEQLAMLSLTPLKRAYFAAFKKEFVALHRGAARLKLSESSLTSRMMQTVKLAVLNGITFPKGAFPLVKSLMYLDGMALRVAPEAMLLRDVARFAGDFPAEPEAVLNHG